MDILKIKSCFIFNTALKSPKPKPSDDEAQDAKLLFYYPQDEELLIKRSNIGIIEGTLAFMSSFEETNTKFILTELNKYYYVGNNYENDFIVVFILEKNTPLFSQNQNIESKKRFLKTFIDNYYNTFILFHNSLTSFFLNKETPYIALEQLPKNKVSSILDFTSSYLNLFADMKLPFHENLVYFPLKDQSQAGILLAIQRLNEKVPEMEMSTIIYRGHIIHNQLPLESCSLIYNIFYNVFDFSSKFNKFKPPKTEQIQTTTATTTNDVNGDSNDNDNDFSPFRKAFDLAGSNNDFLIGLQKASGNNNYNIFIPCIYIRELQTTFKLLVYYYNGMTVFIFLKNSFNIKSNLTTTLVNISKWITKYFIDNIIKELENTFKSKLSYVENSMYVYCNNANKSLKVTNHFYNKKNRELDNEKFDLIQRLFLLNADVEMTSICKYKGYIIYYLNSCERNLVMLYSDNLSLNQVMGNIEATKKSTFESIYLI